MNDVIAFTDSTKLDFLRVSGYKNQKGRIDVVPDFDVVKSHDLMIRGGDFYAIWNEDAGAWSTEEDTVIKIVDSEIRRVTELHKPLEEFGAILMPRYMRSARSGSIDIWHKYCQQQMRDNYHSLDEKLVFSNMKPSKKDYSSKRLPYPLEKGSIDAYDRLMSVLYSPEERHKIEWAIGSIVSGDSIKIQKFLVLYGPPKSGKSTVLNIIGDLFAGYTQTFDAKVLGSSSHQFALEAFRTNPLVAIQQDGDLSRIEDNARLNSLVSHESMLVNLKNKSAYTDTFHTFLFIGTNKPVKITDAKSGLLRRLIDVEPTGDRVPRSEYEQLLSQIKFELGPIAWHCREVYQEDPTAYDDYTPLAMMGATNDFYNYMLDSYLIFARQDGTTLKAAWEMYKQYCDEARVPYPLPYKNFKEELKNYFEDFDERPTLEDGSRPRNWFGGFKKEKFEKDPGGNKSKKTPVSWLSFRQRKSLFDTEFAECIAQYETEDGQPQYKWANVTTRLKDLDTSKTHYVQVPKNLITIDFDIPDDEGNKCFEKNLIAASKWPPTYAELSKSGQGIHLEYIYTGNPEELKPVYDEHIEIKIQKGNSALRRRLSKCNDIPIAQITSGLPLKEAKVVNLKNVQSEKGVRELIKKNLNKEIHPNTKPSIDFIYKILEDAYESGMKYDVSDMSTAVIKMASESTNQADACLKLVAKMKFKSEEANSPETNDEAPIVFFDIECFPNLFLVSWKYQGKDASVVPMFNPSPKDIEDLLKMRLIGFNNRSYDNHMLYGAFIGKNNSDLYRISTNIISDDREQRKKGFNEAYNLSYTDVYDFATKKQSLKKWEIELGIHHQELGLPWDKPVDPKHWQMVAEYCANDVIATEAVFNACEADFNTRLFLCVLSGLTPNDTNRMHITRVLVGDAKHADHIYTDLATGKQFDINGNEIPNAPKNNAFPGYEKGRYGDDFQDPANRKGIEEIKKQFTAAGWEKIKNKRVNMYRGTDVGFGGYVYAEPGMYHEVALLDVGNMHGASILALKKFGKDTIKYREVRDARMAIKKGIKTGDFSEAMEMMDGKLAPYLTSVEEADKLQNALKLILNSTYGIAAATFDNPLKDPRDDNNIIALRGALFMRTLQDEVQKRGYQVVHIKTDSIKIPEADPGIIQFCIDFGRKYGYEFEHEATYSKFCLVNNAVYIAQYDEHGNRSKGGKHAGEWTATGTQFAVPYVFKKLFSGEEIVFEDMCETKSVKVGNIYLDLNEKLTDVSHLEAELAKHEKALKGANIDILQKPNEEMLQLMDASLREKVQKSWELRKRIAKGHDYRFIGRVGLFCPMKPGTGGGVLYRESEGKYYAVTGTSGYRWMEAEEVKKQHKEADIDISYYEHLCDEAVKSISEFGDFDLFANHPWTDWPDVELPF